MGVKRYCSNYLIERRLSILSNFLNGNSFRWLYLTVHCNSVSTIFKLNYIFSFKVGSVVQPTQPDGQPLQESFLIGNGDGPLGSACMSPPIEEAAQVAPNGDGEKNLFYIAYDCVA